MRILIIEDDIDIKDMLALYLKQVCFAVDSTTSGQKGSYLARTNEYDLIILDYMLPEKDGLQICKEIRISGKTMPILMLSVRGEIRHKVELFKHGIDDYMTKPFSYEELMARIRALLRRPHKIEPAVLTVSDMIIDSNAQRVTRGSKEIYLTRKEFALLEYLVKHEGKVVSRGMIMEHVWNMESDPFSNTIEAHIFNLRRKIAHGKSPIIRTIPGRGYKIETYA